MNAFADSICTVCGDKAHGVHFGVLSCRACAAFFRRTVVLSRNYNCRRANDGCEIRKDQRFMCRRCRFNKCVRLGMTPENVQLNRDCLSVVKEERKHQRSSCSMSSDGGVLTSPDASLYASVYNSPETYREEPTPTATPPVTASTSTTFAQRNPIVLHEHMGTHRMAKKNFNLTSFKLRPQSVCHMAHVAEEIRRIMRNFDPDTTLPMAQNQLPLVKMEMALQRYRENQAPNPRIILFVDFADIPAHWERHLYRICEWFMFCEPFRAIPIEEQMVIYKYAWVLWQRFERLQMSYQIYGPNVMNEKYLCVSENSSVDANRVKVDWSSVSDYDSDYVKQIFAPLFSRIFEDVMKPLCEMELSPYEVTYILCQLSFHVEGFPVTDETRKIFIEYRNCLSDNLHGYYTSVLGTPNYASRLIQIMNIVHTIEELQHERSKVLELARIFDVIKIDLCDKMFDF